MEKESPHDSTDSDGEQNKLDIHPPASAEMINEALPNEDSAEDAEVSAESNVSEKPNPDQVHENDSQAPEVTINYIWESVDFTFPQPRVRFAKGSVKEIPRAIFELMDPHLPFLTTQEIQSPKVMFVVGESSLKNTGVLDKVVELCKQNSMLTIVFSCGKGEANVETVTKGVVIALEEKPHFIVGIGGGSVLDTAKSISGIATNGGTIEDYHDGKPFELPTIPFIAVPTTAGTGSEITSNAVLTDYTRGYKKSIRGQHLIPNYILLDPELTISCPPEVTAASGADALVQAIEAYVSRFSHPLADIYAMQAIIMLGRNLQKVVEDGINYDARAEMLLGSYYAGVAFSNVKLGLVHGLAHPIGFKYNISHGKVCAALLPYVVEYNMNVRGEKYSKIAQLLSQLDFFTRFEPDASDQENTRRLAAMLKELFVGVKLPVHLSELGVLKEDFEWIIENTKGGSVDANPRTPDPESLRELLEKAF